MYYHISTNGAKGSRLSKDSGAACPGGEAAPRGTDPPEVPTGGLDRTAGNRFHSRLPGEFRSKGVRYRSAAVVLLASWGLAGGGVRAQTAGPAAAPAAADAVSVETVVFIRHGEKPADDKGQLNCRGLNRALALPDVLIGKYGRADFIFAPSTTKRSGKDGPAFSYVRPLATIEPTAIRLDLPVETRFAFDDIASLEEEISTVPYRRATIFVAWEHHLLDEMVKHFMVSLGGDPHQVPDWPGDDFDSIFVLHIRTDRGKRTVAFSHEQEGLDGMPMTCPGPAR